MARRIIGGGVAAMLVSIAVAQTSPATDGEVRRVDRDAGKVTVRHGEIVNLGMPPMTMVFRVKEPAQLGALKPGDLIRFRAEQDGSIYFITEIEPLPTAGSPVAQPVAGGIAQLVAPGGGAGASTGVTGAAGASASSHLSIVLPWVRSTRPGQRNAAGYLEVHSAATDRLVGVTLPADVAARTELHTMRMEGDLMLMREVEAFEFGMGRRLVLEPGGNHLMLMDLKRPLAVGETVEAVLVFEKGGEVPVRMEVRESPPIAVTGGPVPRGAAHVPGAAPRPQHAGPAR